MSTQPGTGPATTGIRITPKFFPLMFILFFFKPRLGVDGSEMVGQWNAPTFIPAAAGQHTVTVYFPYLFPKQAGKGSISVSVVPNQIVDVSYKAPWLVFLPGRMKVG